MTITRVTIVAHVSILMKCSKASHVKTLKMFYQLIWCIPVWYTSVIFNIVSIVFTKAWIPCECNSFDCLRRHLCTNSCTSSLDWKVYSPRAILICPKI